MAFTWSPTTYLPSSASSPPAHSPTAPGQSSVTAHVPAPGLSASLSSHTLCLEGRNSPHFLFYPASLQPHMDPLWGQALEYLLNKACEHIFVYESSLPHPAFNAYEVLNCYLHIVTFQKHTSEFYCDNWIGKTEIRELTWIFSQFIKTWGFLDWKSQGQRGTPTQFPLPGIALSHGHGCSPSWQKEKRYPCCSPRMPLDGLNFISPQIHMLKF